LRKPASHFPAFGGFTLVEVMMAATILTVGFMGLIQAVTITSGMMDQARRQTLAAQILSHEIEQLRFKTWTQIQSLGATTPTPINSTNNVDSPFLEAISISGATYNLSRSVSDVVAGSLREVTFTVTWVVKSSRRDNSGNPVTFTYTRVNSAYLGKYGLNLTYQRS
jgi:Tfp pilus assembly protein PilV